MNEVLHFGQIDHIFGASIPMFFHENPISCWFLFGYLTVCYGKMDETGPFCSMVYDYICFAKMVVFHGKVLNNQRVSH